MRYYVKGSNPYRSAKVNVGDLRYHVPNQEKYHKLKPSLCWVSILSLRPRNYSHVLLGIM